MWILVAEDEPDLAAALRAGLGAEGYSVDVAPDGLTAVQLGLHGDYDAIVLDLMLPHLSGYSVIEKLRAAGVTVPILVLTAKTGDYDHADALDTGADDFLSKPFTFTVLLARLRALIRRASTSNGQLSVGDLHLHLLSRTCVRGETQIALTRMEFALLELLARHPDEPVAKERILAELWPDVAATPNLVEARILALRRKVDTPFARTSIETVRGLGYRLTDDSRRRP